MNPHDPSIFENVLKRIGERAGPYDLSGQWPEADLMDLASMGAARWSAPAAFGGADLPALELHLAYEKLAAASLATALVFTQRDSAVKLIDGAEEWPLRESILTKLAANELFATIGIAQLTTSRQGGKPALRASETAGGYRIDGLIPWSTGAAKSRYIIAGAALPDGQQILFALPPDARGVNISGPMPLVALRSSWTSQIHCDEVCLDRQWVMRGPVEKALSFRGRGQALGQAFLAMGFCRGAIDLLRAHTSARAGAAADRFTRQLETIRGEVLLLSQDGHVTDAGAAAPRIRGALNDLAIRATHTAVSIYKGTALLEDHPAQRLCREAMFLLVWSCPDPVIDCTVELLAD